jgi:hypothetical protein
MSRQQDFYQALGNPEAGLPTGLRTWNGSDPARRFAVYRNNVLASLMDALADSFPVVQALVGVDFFRAMAQLYVRQFPPESPILAEYGDRLPSFIRDFAPAAGVPYLGDVAWLEWLRIRSFHSADGQSVSAATLAEVWSYAASLPDRQLTLHPSLQLFSSPYAVVSIWAAHQGEGELAAPQQIQQQLATLVLDTPQQALLLRTGLTVDLIPVDAGTHGFIAGLHRGLTLGEAMAQASQQHAGFEVTPALMVLIQHGAVIHFSDPLRAGDSK